MSEGSQSKRTTIYDLAELAGTSASAVSAVLNGNWKKRRISEKLALKIQKIAEEQGYAVNMQASALRRERSRIIGMIVPKYDNRYFGSIVERFEQMARAQGMFPIVTCTQRDPDLEVQAAKAMLSYQVECVISTGATDPDRITEICQPAGVRTINLDLPGTLAPSVISDNFGGAFELTRRVLAAHEARMGAPMPLLFVGGRGTDHNTAERIRGFCAAHEEAGLPIRRDCILACGYAAEKAERALIDLAGRVDDLPMGMFVNSTISLEGALRWIKVDIHRKVTDLTLGCFDWDPMAELLVDDMLMVRQDVPGMLAAVAEMLADDTPRAPEILKIPPIMPERV